MTLPGLDWACRQSLIPETDNKFSFDNTVAGTPYEEHAQGPYAGHRPYSGNIPSMWDIPPKEGCTFRRPKIIVFLPTILWTTSISSMNLTRHRHCRDGLLATSFPIVNCSAQFSTVLTSRVHAQNEGTLVCKRPLGCSHCGVFDRQYSTFKVSSRLS